MTDDNNKTRLIPIDTLENHDHKFNSDFEDDTVLTKDVKKTPQKTYQRKNRIEQNRAANNRELNSKTFKNNGKFNKIKHVPNSIVVNSFKYLFICLLFGYILIFSVRHFLPVNKNPTTSDKQSNTTVVKKDSKPSTDNSTSRLQSSDVNTTTDASQSSYSESSQPTTTKDISKDPTSTSGDTTTSKVTTTDESTSQNSESQANAETSSDNTNKTFYWIDNSGTKHFVSSAEESEKELANYLSSLQPK